LLLLVVAVVDEAQMLEVVEVLADLELALLSLL
jgi:hypothetical protein